jgi:hypothetical protein
MLKIKQLKKAMFCYKPIRRRATITELFRMFDDFMKLKIQNYQAVLEYA